MKKINSNIFGKLIGNESARFVSHLNKPSRDYQRLLRLPKVMIGQKVSHLNQIAVFIGIDLAGLEYLSTYSCSQPV